MTEAARSIWSVVLLAAISISCIVWTAVLAHLALLLWQKSWGLV